LKGKERLDENGQHCVEEYNLKLCFSPILMSLAQEHQTSKVLLREHILRLPVAQFLSGCVGWWLVIVIKKR
jgi:hypothetical protein